MGSGEKKRKDKPEIQQSSHRKRIARDMKPVPWEEVRNPDESSLIALIMLIKLIEELTYGLTRVQRMTWWLIFMEGKSVSQAAVVEGVERSAIYDRLRRMARHNEYVALAIRYGRLRPRLNQHEFRSNHKCRPRTPVPELTTDLNCWESEGGALATGPHFR